MDVTSLYTNTPQEEGILNVCKAYEIFYDKEPPIPYTTTRKGAKVNPLGKLVPVHWKTLPTLYKPMVQPWGQKWQSLLPISPHG